jgi:hypothetical protein
MRRARATRVCAIRGAFGGEGCTTRCSLRSGEGRIYSIPRLELVIREFLVSLFHSDSGNRNLAGSDQRSGFPGGDKDQAQVADLAGRQPTGSASLGQNLGSIRGWTKAQLRWCDRISTPFTLSGSGRTLWASGSESRSCSRPTGPWPVSCRHSRTTTDLQGAVPSGLHREMTSTKIRRERRGGRPQPRGSGQRVSVSAVCFVLSKDSVASATGWRFPGRAMERGLFDCLMFST